MPIYFGEFRPHMTSGALGLWALGGCLEGFGGSKTETFCVFVF